MVLSKTNNVIGHTKKGIATKGIAAHPALEPDYSMRDMMIVVGTRNMATNPLSWSSKSAVEPANKNKGFKCLQKST